MKCKIEIKFKNCQFPDEEIKKELEYLLTETAKVTIPQNGSIIITKVLVPENDFIQEVMDFVR